MHEASVAGNLKIEDLPSGINYLNQLQLTNPVLAEQQLMVFLDALLASSLDSSILYALLEQARPVLCFVEEEMARHYHNRPLPLDRAEDACFSRVVAAWQKMAQAYTLCADLEVLNTANPDYAPLIATILHRRIYYSGLVILEHYHARRELPVGVWLDLHRAYASAEAWGVASLAVEDTLENTQQATHCSAAFVTLLLIDLANPYSKSLRNLNLVRRWACLWAPLVAIQPLDSAPELPLPPFMIELMKDLPLHPTALTEEPGRDARLLDTKRLGLQIDHLLGQLRQRITPSRLGLGEETTGHVIQLLEYLSRPWTQLASPRRYRRFATQGVGVARLAMGFEAMYFFISQQAFEQPISGTTYNRQDFDQLFTFGERAEPGLKLGIRSPTDFECDDWTVINHSANGFRLVRSGSGQRANHDQLMAVLPHDGEHFLLGYATWLMQEEAGELVVGLATLPGLPVGVGVRRALEHGCLNDEEFHCAFLLPPVAAIHSDGSLVIPAGLYKASGELELYNAQQLSRIRMCHILHRGHDFDRISYETL